MGWVRDGYAFNDRVSEGIRQYGLGGVELLAGGAYNYGVRLLGGAASVPYALSSADAAAGVQTETQNRFGYEMRSDGAKMIGEALAPVGQVIHNSLAAARGWSEDTIGLGATAIGFGAVQAGVEIAGVVSGGRALQGAVDGALADTAFVIRPMPTGQMNVVIPGAQLFDGSIVRINTVTDAMRDTFRGNGYLDPLSNTFKAAPLNDVMAVDHILPTKEIINLDNFNKLTAEQMTNILQDKIGLSNLQPLPQSLNASKGSLTDWNTYGTQRLDSTYSQNLISLQRNLQDSIQTQIAAYQRINRGGK